MLPCIYAPQLDLGINEAPFKNKKQTGRLIALKNVQKFTTLWAAGISCNEPLRYTWIKVDYHYHLKKALNEVHNVIIK